MTEVLGSYYSSDSAPPGISHRNNVTALIVCHTNVLINVRRLQTKCSFVLFQKFSIIISDSIQCHYHRYTVKNHYTRQLFKRNRESQKHKPSRRSQIASYGRGRAVAACNYYSIYTTSFNWLLSWDVSRLALRSHSTAGDREQVFVTPRISSFRIVHPSAPILRVSTQTRQQRIVCCVANCGLIICTWRQLFFKKHKIAV